MSDDRKPEQKVKICGMYRNTSARGTEYFVGYAGQVKYLLFPVRDPVEKGPGWELHLAENPRREDHGRGAASGANPNASSRRPDPVPAPAPAGRYTPPSRGTDDDYPPF
jgi:hypothetical protein